MNKNQLLLLAVLRTWLGSLTPVVAQGTAFTYQGRLNDGASPATGIYDLRCAIYDALASAVRLAARLRARPPP
jgi:hypothetical protein